MWSDHVLPWWEHRNDPHILFLKYEDLKEVINYLTLHIFFFSICTLFNRMSKVGRRCFVFALPPGSISIRELAPLS